MTAARRAVVAAWAGLLLRDRALREVVLARPESSAARATLRAASGRV